MKIMRVMSLLTLIAGVSLYSALTLEAEEQTYGRVTGKALFPDGSAPKGVTIYLSPETAQKMTPASVPQRSQATLADDGSFAFDGIPAWRMGWALRVKGEDIVALPAYQMRLTVKPGEEVKRDITIYRGGTVSGRVTRAEDGKPVKGARLSFGEQDPPVNTTSREDGSFRLSPVMPGKRYISCKTEDFILAGQWAIVGEEQETKDVDFTLKRGGFIVGRVVMPDGVTPAPRAHLGLEPIGAPKNFRGAILGSYVRGDGSFRTTPEPSGAYRLTVRWPGGKLMKVTHRAAIPRVVVRPGKETEVIVKLEIIR